jgi:hypothetical protein
MKVLERNNFWLPVVVWVTKLLTCLIYLAWQKYAEVVFLVVCDPSMNKL